MALDGMTLHLLLKELQAKLQGAKIEKIYQPTRDELVFSLRGKGGSHKLLMSACAAGPRVHITGHAPENPATPPMLCMLLRKLLVGGRLEDISQPSLERVSFFDFTGYNELGDKQSYRLAVEIMARHSNIMLIDGQGRIVDSIKRIDASDSSVRLILPGMKYVLPPAHDKLDLLEQPPERIFDYLQSSETREPSKALLNSLQGASPIVCREVAHRCGGSFSEKPNLISQLARLRGYLDSGDTPTMVCDPEGKPVDFSFMPISQYGGQYQNTAFPDYSALLDGFYAERDRLNRIKVRAADLYKTLHNARSRIARKLGYQHADLQKCASREELRIRGELLNANLHHITKGQPFCELANYYDNMQPLRIKLDPRFSPAQNAQKYFKDYRKACKAEDILKELIVSGERELEYIETVLFGLSGADTEQSIAEIRRELAEQGYIKSGRQPTKQSKKQAAELPPFEYTSPDGFTILVGRNNRQNDALTLKFARGKDIWLHVKGFPGAHTVVISHGADVPHRTVVKAAEIAAAHSRAKDSAQVPVDYTFVKNVKKPAGAKPGMVIYEGHKTLYVTPGA